MMPAKACGFCGARADTREHTLPKWIGRVLLPRLGPGLVTRQRDFPTRSVALNRFGPLGPYEVPLGGFCEGCNNRWMSGLETAAKPFLTKMMLGERQELTRADQRKVAVWAAKTALVLAATERELSGVPEDAYRWFMNERRPLDGMTVWVALRGSTGRPRSLYVHRFFGNDHGELDERPPSEVWGWYSTIVLGHLVLQVRHYFGPGRSPDWHAPGVDGVFALQVWPFRQILAWPDLPPLDEDAVRDFSGAGPVASLPARLRAR